MRHVNKEEMYGGDLKKSWCRSDFYLLFEAKCPENMSEKVVMRLFLCLCTFI